MRRLSQINGIYSSKPMAQSDLPPMGVYLTAQLQASLSDYISQVTSGMSEIENKGSYLDQVRKSRDIWPLYGEQGRYPDPVVSMAMDLHVAAATAFGMELLFKDIDAEHPAKQVVDHWSANVNAGKPTLTQGLDFIRSQWHMMRWSDGGVVPAWSERTPMETHNGIKYSAPQFLGLLPRTQFEMRKPKKGDFGGFELKYRDALRQGQNTDEIGKDEKQGEVNGFLAAGRYHVCDRNRIESAQMYPVPFLVQRGLTSICTMIRAMHRGDYQTVLRVIRAILLITRGSDTWVEKFRWKPTDQDFSAIRETLTQDGSGKFANVLANDYTTQAKWVQPDMEALMSADKFTQLNMARLAGLGIVEITSSDRGVQSKLNPKPLIMEVASAMKAEARFMEGVLFPILWDANPSIFDGIAPCNFHQKPFSIFLDIAEKQVLRVMFERGLLSLRSWLELSLGYGADIEAEAHQRQYEQASGYDEIFEPRTLFTQTVKDNGRPPGELDKEPRESMQGAESHIITAYDDLRGQVKRAAVSEADSDSRKKVVAAIVLGIIAGLSVALKDRIREFYSSQFDGDALALSEFEPYIQATGERLQKFGNDLLEGSASGTQGIYSAMQEDDTDTAIDKVFAAQHHRAGLYDTEPFRVAGIAADAAKAAATGKAYAVRKSAFSPTTCQECIDRHGEIMTIAQVMAGDWDHPHGICSFEFHGDVEAAMAAASELMSMEQITAVCEAMDALDDILMAEEYDA